MLVQWIFKMCELCFTIRKYPLLEFQTLKNDASDKFLAYHPDILIYLENTLKH